MKLQQAHAARAAHRGLVFQLRNLTIGMLSPAALEQRLQSHSQAGCLSAATTPRQRQRAGESCCHADELSDRRSLSVLALPSCGQWTAGWHSPGQPGAGQAGAC